MVEPVYIKEVKAESSVAQPEDVDYVIYSDAACTVEIGRDRWYYGVRLPKGCKMVVVMGMWRNAIWV